MAADRTILWKWLAVPLCAAAVACGDSGGDGDGDACDDATCVTPPAPTCSGDVLVEYAATGSCGLDDACVYETTSTPCAAGCAEGACVDQAPCDGVTCDEPPAATCDGDTLLTFADSGTCDEASGDCSYDMTETDCTENGEQCRAGACVDVTNICEGVTCDAPPADSCNADGEIVAYDAAGECNADTGECEYTSTTITCDEGLVCSGGACVDEGGACVDVVCDSPPPAECDGNDVNTYTGGTCDEATGNCVYEATTTTCDEGFTCFEGACVEDAGLCDDVTCTPSPAECDESGQVVTYSSSCDPGTGECVETPDAVACDEGFTCLLGGCVEDSGLCDGVTCDDPEPACFDETSVVTGVGVCNPTDGTCGVSTTTTPCDTGSLCRDGACVPEADPCLDVTCDPPAPFCNGAGQVVTSTDGVCDSADGTCSFTETTAACDTGFVCFDGACIEDAGLCDGVTCDAQPASCSDDTTVVTFSSPVCDPADGLCDYTETLTPCDTDQLCRDGACVDAGSICDTIVCEPRDNSCFDDTTLLVWASECNADTGTCDESSSNVTCPGGGFCVLGECVGGTLCAGVTCPARAPICDTDGNPITFGPGTCDEFTGECEYTGTPDTCADGSVCDAGVCVADLCADVTCEPIGATCDIDGNLVTYGDGECQAATGDCVYPPTSTPCDAGDVCIDGACVPGATCDTITCDAPPADTCNTDGNAVQYQAVGTCNETTLACEYTSSVVVCDGATPTCVAGVCAGPAAPGDIAITEVMYDLPGEDDFFEWFEIQNVSDVDVDLSGMVVFDTSVPPETFTIGDLALAPGAVAVFGQTATAAPTVDVDWGGIDAFRLSNTADEIILELDGVELDRVEYDEGAGWPTAIGRSLSLDTALAADNNNGANWCFGVDVYDDANGALGSPGFINAACDFVCYDVSCPPPSPTCDVDVAISYTGDGTCDSVDGTCDYASVTVSTPCDAVTERCLNGACIETTASITAGDLTITEFMANPDGTDTDFEWFEVLNTSGAELSLTGLLVTSGAGESFAVTTAETLAAGEYIVFAQSDVAVPGTVRTINWGGEPVLLLANGGDEITLEWDGAVVDTLTFDPTWPISSATSAQFGGDPTADDNADPANWCLSISPYDATSVGTPGAANDGCGPTGDAIPFGSVFFTEVLQNPSGDDTGLEWFELYNSNATPISLDGVTITDNDGDSFTVPPGTGLEVAAFSFAVFGSSESAAGGAVDFVYTGMSLANGADELVLSSAGAEVNRIEWDGGPDWPDPNGASMSLDPGSFLGSLNNDPFSWCEGVGLYDGTNSGTPGAPNPACFALP